MASPEHAAMLERLRAAGISPSEPRDEARAAVDVDGLMIVPVPPDLDVDEIELGGVPCLQITPLGGGNGRVLVFLHGGGYVYFSPRTHLATAAGLVRASGSRCVSVGYRLAPEHPFPAAVEDSVAVYRGLLDEGIEPGRIAFAGDSAGGGLVLSALAAIRDAGLPMAGAGICISPWTDLAITGASAKSVDDPVIGYDSLQNMALAYLAGAPAESPGASPLYADLSGLPPILVQVGTREALLDDARRIVPRLRAAGVDVTLHEFQDVVHMWVVWGPDIPEAVEAFDEAAAFMDRHLAE